MTDPDALKALREGLALYPSPMREEMAELHLPFDDLVGRPVHEQRLTDELTNASIVAIAGPPDQASPRRRRGWG